MAAPMTDVLARTVASAPIIKPASHVVMETRALNGYFGSTHAVRDVSLGFPEHEVTAIIGPSGCGKSTLLRCLNRMHETVPLARVGGAVLLHGRDIYGADVDPIALRRRTDPEHDRAAGAHERQAPLRCGRRLRGPSTV